jgi:Protein of unknown function (DUF669)
MAVLEQDFNTDQIPEDDRNFDPLPAGDYQMQVIASEVKATKANNGDQLLELTLEIVSGPLERRRIWDRLNIRNQNADAQRIAQRQLADLCLAVGIVTLRNTDELHFKPFVGRVGVRVDKSGQYGPQNTVRYRQRGNTPPTNKPASTTGGGGATTTAAASSPTPNAAPPQRAAAGSARPWSR